MGLIRDIGLCGGSRTRENNGVDNWICRMGDYLETKMEKAKVVRK